MGKMQKTGEEEGEILAEARWDPEKGTPIPKGEWNQGSEAVPDQSQPDPVIPWPIAAEKDSAAPEQPIVRPSDAERPKECPPPIPDGANPGGDMSADQAITMKRLAREVEGYRLAFLILGTGYLFLAFCAAMLVPYVAHKFNFLDAAKWDGGNWRPAGFLILLSFGLTLGYLVLSYGTVFLRSWAPALIQACGTVLGSTGTACLIYLGILYQKIGPDLGSQLIVPAIWIGCLFILGPTLVSFFTGAKGYRLACDLNDAQRAPARRSIAVMMLVPICFLAAIFWNSLFFANASIPFFQTVLRGQAAFPLVMAVGANLMLATYFNFKGQKLGWWLTLVSFTLIAASFCWLFLGNEPGIWLDSMGLSVESRTMVNSHLLFDGKGLAIAVGTAFLFLLLILGAASGKYRQPEQSELAKN